MTFGDAWKLHPKLVLNGNVRSAPATTAVEPNRTLRSFWSKVTGETMPACRELDADLGW
jgi:hypothetical protein